MTGSGYDLGPGAMWQILTVAAGQVSKCGQKTKRPVPADRGPARAAA